QRVASRGREPGLTLVRGEREVPLVEWAGEMIAGCAPIAEAMDRAQDTTAHARAVAVAKGCLADPSLTPSARVLAAMYDVGDSYVRFVLAQSIAHKAAILALPFAPELEDRFAAQAEASIVDQRRIEESDVVPFETYRQNYLAPIRLRT